MCVFFKQKRAYELRISDWSSDVCSSDLIGVGDLPAAVVMRLFAHAPAPDDDGLRLAHGLALPPGAIIRYLSAMTRLCFPARQRSAHADWVPRDVLFPQIGRAPCRERVCQYV